MARVEVRTPRDALYLGEAAEIAGDCAWELWNSPKVMDFLDSDAKHGRTGRPSVHNIYIIAQHGFLRTASALHVIEFTF
jgi:hypothetical protein